MPKEGGELGAAGSSLRRGISPGRFSGAFSKAGRRERTLGFSPGQAHSGAMDSIPFPPSLVVGRREHYSPVFAPSVRKIGTEGTFAPFSTPSVRQIGTEGTGAALHC